MVDTPAWGAGPSNGVEVRVLSAAQKHSGIAQLARAADSESAGWKFEPSYRYK